MGSTAAKRCETRVRRENQRQFASSQPFSPFTQNLESSLISFNYVRHLELSRHRIRARDVVLLSLALGEGTLAGLGVVWVLVCPPLSSL